MLSLKHCIFSCIFTYAFCKVQCFNLFGNTSRNLWILQLIGHCFQVLGQVTAWFTCLDQVYSTDLHLIDSLNTNLETSCHVLSMWSWCLHNIHSRKVINCRNDKILTYCQRKISLLHLWLCYYLKIVVFKNWITVLYP